MAGRDDSSQRPEPRTDTPPLHVQGDELRRLLAASEKHGVPPVDLTTLRFSLVELDLLPLEIARRHQTLSLILTKADGREVTIPVKHTLTDKQIGWFKAGSALNALQ